MRHRRAISAFMSILLLSSVGGLMISCGGGGGGGGQQLQTLSLSVMGKVTTDGSPPDSQLTVEVISLDTSGKQVDKATVQTVLNSSDTTMNGSYSASVDVVEGGKIVVSAYAPGYTKATKTLIYKSGTALSVNLDLQRVTSTTVNINGGLVISSSGRRHVRIAFVKDGNGVKALTGLRAANASSKVIDIGIPVDALQTNTLTVNYRSYNPSNPNDYANFPGTETDSGEDLVSIGFDYLEIKDDQGNNPFRSAGLSAQLLSGEYYRILRQVDCTQIENIRNTIGSLDENPNKPGIQLTFYAYDGSQGAWVRAGEATFVDNNTIDFMNSEWDTIVQSGCDPNSSSTDNTDGTASCSEYGVFTDENDVCSDSNDYVVISVTNPALEWKNLDYVVPGGSQVSCDIKVVDENNNPLSGVWVTANASCMAYIDGMTDGSGNVRLETIGWSDQCSASVEAWYILKSGRTTANFDRGNRCSVTVTLSNPFKCTVTGKVVDENNNPVEGLFVYAYSTGGSSYGITDSQGRFSVPSVCNSVSYVFAKFSSKSYSVDGTKNYDEVSDNGTSADVGTLQIVNDPPYGNLYSFQSPEVGQPITVSVCAFDLENDYPVSYEVKHNGSTVATGQINSGSNCAQVNVDISTTGTHVFTGTFTDSGGRSAPSGNDIVLNIENTSHHIRGSIYGSGSYYSFSEGNETYEFITIFAFTSFTDSDIAHTVSITSASYTCYDSANNPVGNGSLPITGDDWLLCYYSTGNGSWCDAQIPANTYSCDITLTASDGFLSITHTKNVKVLGR